MSKTVRFKSIDDLNSNMNEYQRQMVLLVGFMTLLAAVILFLFVYAPDPVDAPSIGAALPEPVNQGLNATISGWEAFMSDFQSGMDVTS